MNSSGAPAPNPVDPRIVQAANDAIDLINSRYNVRLFFASDKSCIKDIKPTTQISDITPMWLFAGSGNVLLLSKRTAEVTDKFFKSLEEITDGFFDTQTGNDIFESAMEPAMARVRKAMRRGDTEGAFAELMSMSRVDPDAWAIDNEVWMETDFPKFFYEFSEAWRSILALPEPQIAGLVNPWAGQSVVSPHTGLAQSFDGVQKQRLTQWLEGKQKDYNRLLKDIGRACGAGVYKKKTARVTIFDN